MKKLYYFLSIFLLTLSSCGTSEEETKTYDDYKINHLTSLNEFFSLEHETYFIELYQIECSHCNATKTTIFNYLDEQNQGNKEIPLYLFDMNEGDGKANRNLFKAKPSWYDRKNYDQLIREMEQNHPSSLSENYFIGTPTIYEIKDKKINKVYVGKNDVNGVLNNN